MLRVDVELEILRTELELLGRVLSLIQAQQLGEAFVGLDDRRVAGSMRGEDRRCGS